MEFDLFFRLLYLVFLKLFSRVGQQCRQQHQHQQEPGRGRPEERRLPRALVRIGRYDVFHTLEYSTPAPPEQFRCVFYHNACALGSITVLSCIATLQKQKHL